MNSFDATSDIANEVSKESLIKLSQMIASFVLMKARSLVVKTAHGEETKM